MTRPNECVQGRYFMPHGRRAATRSSGPDTGYKPTARRWVAYKVLTHRPLSCGIKICAPGLVARCWGLLPSRSDS